MTFYLPDRKQHDSVCGLEDYRKKREEDGRKKGKGYEKRNYNETLFQFDNIFCIELMGEFSEKLLFFGFLLRGIPFSELLNIFLYHNHCKFEFFFFFWINGVN